jgi:hypothetical protein
MPYGFFTVEQWKRSKGRAKGQWTTILHLDAGQSLTGAIKAINRRGKPGLFRVIQTQRHVWAEMERGKLRLRCWHASTSEGLARLAAAYDRDGGKWPVEKERRERATAKAARK